MFKHQQQPTDSSSAHTCVAMLLDIPVAKILETFTIEPMSDNTLTSLIIGAGFYTIPVSSSGRTTFAPNCTYICSVTSPNTIGKTHTVLLHIRTDGFAILYDPLKESETTTDLQATIDEQDWSVIYVDMIQQSSSIDIARLNELIIKEKNL